MAESDIEAFAQAPAEELRPAGFMKWAGPDRLTLAMVFTDIVGSTALNERIRDERYLGLRRAHFAQSRRLIGEHAGCEIKTIGDAFLAVFRSVDKALDYALALCASPGADQLAVRAGIHIGAVQPEEGDVFGRHVNFAARVVGKIKDAEIWLSQAAMSDIDELGAERFAGVRWDPHEEMELKGFDGKHCLWSMASRAASAEPISENRRWERPEGVGKQGRPPPLRAHRPVASPQNFAHEDFLSHAEVFIEAAQGRRPRRVTGQVNLHERMVVRGPETGAEVRFGFKRMFVEVSKTGDGTLTPPEDLRRGVVAPRARLAPPRSPRRKPGDLVRVCVDAEDGSSLGDRAIPGIGEDNLNPELAVASHDVAAAKVKAAILLRLDPEGVHIDGEAGDRVSARKRQLIEAIVDTAVRRGETTTEERLIRRPVKVQVRPRGG